MTQPAPKPLSAPVVTFLLTGAFALIGVLAANLAKAPEVTAVDLPAAVVVTPAPAGSAGDASLRR